MGRRGPRIDTRSTAEDAWHGEEKEPEIATH